MAIKKSELYSSLWASCDELRGGMDASQYKDYVLALLFIKYVSDKYAGQPYAPIVIPDGASFQDMVKLKGKDSIGDDINKKIIAPLWDANKLSDPPDFNDSNKLGSGKEMVDRLTNLVSIFERPELNFSKNRAEGDDLLGDAYEYLMRNFATESGKSKGQFYTPAEVSRVMAQIIGIENKQSNQPITVYDPTCGSGSLLLKVADQARSKVTLNGQEKDSATAGLARMNMILHNYPTADIRRQNTISTPLFTKDGALTTFDFVVANPPFSDKRWSTGIDPERDVYGRFQNFGVPPEKNGDYAYLLHIVRSLKPRGKGACILPHGVLFRGNAEAVIRRNLVKKGLIRAIIGLPPNLFFGTGIPACIVMVDKERAESRREIFMVDAGKGFMKDGNKNRLRDRDIHKIVDAFHNATEIPGYSRMVGLDEIEKNDFNLNIPRYIDGSDEDDRQDIEAHLHGGIPKTDIEDLAEYWKVFPRLKHRLYVPSKRSDAYFDIRVQPDEVRQLIFEDEEFGAYQKRMNSLFEDWKNAVTPQLRSLTLDFTPKDVIYDISEKILSVYSGAPLMDKYDVYQHLMRYWYDVLQDDAYMISSDGWQAKTNRILETNKKGKQVDKGWTCDLLPKELVLEDKWMAALQAKIQGEMERLSQRLATRIKELAERYAEPLPELSSQVEKMEKKVNSHLKAMGFSI